MPTLGDDSALCALGEAVAMSGAGIGMSRRGFARLVGGLGVAALASGCSGSGDALAAITGQGDLEGVMGDGVRIWRGVPFAAPPVEELRGCAPQGAASWSGVRSAADFSADAVQLNPTPDPGEALRGSEDCLYLNIWAPQEDSASSPVVVWIHGGGFTAGSAADPRFDGTSFARSGLVYVSINYRLGGFGFLLGDRDPASSNLGLLDQITALEWIRDNIAAFGGDATTVTVMGQSAGAMAISQLMSAPRADGLFHRAVVLSGGPTSVFAHGEAAAIRDRTVAAAGVDGVDALLALPAIELNAACERLTGESVDPLLGGSPYHSAVDGIVLPTHPLDGLRPIPTLIGLTENEVALFESPVHSTFLDGLLVKKRALVGEPVWGLIESAYQDSARPGRDWAGDLWNDAFVGIPSLRLADGLSELGADVWTYRFDYAGAGVGGATHTADIAFVFDNPGSVDARWDSAGRELARAMHAAVVKFIRFGDPGVAGLPQWPQHTPNGLSFMRFDAEPSVGVDFIGEQRRAAWAPVPNVDI